MIAGIVLAAGMSTRMGAFKQLLPLGERRVVQVVVERLVGRLDAIYVVVGHRAREVRAALAGYPVECVCNPDYRSGMSSSVKCGVLAADQADGYLICLGDQPGIEEGVVEAVLTGAERAGKGIVIPCHGGKRGHPILVGRRYREEILQLPGDRGLNAVTRRHPDDTLEVSVDERRILEDMDTPDDYRRERERLTDTDR